MKEPKECPRWSLTLGKPILGQSLDRSSQLLGSMNAERGPAEYFALQAGRQGWYKNVDAVAYSWERHAVDSVVGVFVVPDSPSMWALAHASAIPMPNHQIDHFAQDSMGLSAFHWPSHLCVATHVALWHFAALLVPSSSAAAGRRI